MERSHSPEPSLPSPLLSQRNESSRLESVLALSEFKYAKDITRLQQALLRARRMQHLALISLQLRLLPVVRTVQRLMVKCGFYKWKGASAVTISYRYKRTMASLRHVGKKKLQRAFITFRERGIRAAFMRRIEKPVFANGALAPVSLSDSDSEH